MISIHNTNSDKKTNKHFGEILIRAVKLGIDVSKNTVIREDIHTKEVVLWSSGYNFSIILDYNFRYQATHQYTGDTFSISENTNLQHIITWCDNISASYDREDSKTNHG